MSVEKVPNRLKPHISRVDGRWRVSAYVWVDPGLVTTAMSYISRINKAYRVEVLA
jgi:hypothetical protein